MEPRATQMSEFEGFKKGLSSKYETPMYVKNGGRLHAGGWDNNEIAHAVLGAVALPPMAYGAYKLINHLKNKNK